MAEMRVNIPIDQLKTVVCPDCQNALFVTAVQLKEVPALYSPTGRAEYMAAPYGFLCTNCLSIISVRPPEKPEEGKVLTFPGREN